MASEETLRAIEESSAARLAGNLGHYRTLSRQTRALLRRDKERYVRTLAEDVEGCFNANNLRPAYRALKKLHSKSTSQTSTIHTADGRIVSDVNEVRSRWAEYFEQLYEAEGRTSKPTAILSWCADVGCRSTSRRNSSLSC